MKTVNQKTLAIQLNEMYVDYFNNFLTIEKFASYHNMPLSLAKCVVKSGRKINHNRDLLNQLYDDEYLIDQLEIKL